MSNITNQIEKLEKERRNQLKKLKQKKLELVEKRKDEMMDIVVKVGALTLNDRLFAGAMLFLANQENDQDPIIAKFNELGKTIKIPSRRRRKLKK